MSSADVVVRVIATFLVIHSLVCFGLSLLYHYLVHPTYLKVKTGIKPTPMEWWLFTIDQGVKSLMTMCCLCSAVALVVLLVFMAIVAVCQQV